MIFTKHSETGYKNPLPGITQKTTVFGERTLMAEFVMQNGSVLPKHSHPYEQTGYLVRGNIRLTIDNQEFDVHAGDSWNIPLNVEHGAVIIDDSIAVEVFSPLREDYLPAS